MQYNVEFPNIERGMNAGFSSDESEMNAGFAAAIDITSAVKYTEQSLNDAQKEQARDNIGAASKAELQEVTNGVAGSSEAIRKAQQDIQGIRSEIDNEIQKDLQYILEELDYKEIKITSFASTAASTYEIGSVIDAVTLSWVLSKDPESQSMNGSALDVDVRSKVYNNVSTAQNYTLKVTDERGATDTASSSIKFYNGVYSGVLNDGAAIDSAAILTMSRSLQSTRVISFSANAGAGQRHAYALPSRYGTPGFKDTETGFQAGFHLAETIELTNASGYTEDYDVWLSNYPALGSMTVSVS